MRDFRFLTPPTLPEALAMLADLGEDACVMAGGTALLLGMRQRMLSPDSVVSLHRLQALKGITVDPTQGLTIGALVRHADVARSPEVQRHYPMLADMAQRLANPQVRNRATIGGNLCYADPATDPPTCLIALDAEVTLVGPDGTRRLAMRDFAVDYYTTALEPGELLTTIHLPPPDTMRVGLYRRLLRTPAEHRPVASIALTLLRNGDLVSDARLVIGAATPAPQTMIRAQAFLEGRRLTPDTAAEAAALVAAEIAPLSDGRGDAAFRRQIAQVNTRRMLAELGGHDWRLE
ncbi:MAG: xanthine dehydrogenase family protein subunit M [Rhodobacter sp.]|nr:xanthine dehydrogenase family protein subunit M [Paracoccaceae bacterium]MCC0077024.1 xanthine dehydrogenase family protein subunit M [Rhodobacter sp.]